MTFLWRGKVRGDTPIMRARGPGRAGWIVVDFRRARRTAVAGSRMARGDRPRRAVAVEAWRRDPMVASVTVYDAARPIDVVAEIAVRG